MEWEESIFTESIKNIKGGFMMKKILYRVFIGLVLLCVFSLTVLADQPWIVWVSSEWEATGFNNGVRMVRDSNGYFHAFWHSQQNNSAAPCGANCDIFYSYTTAPAVEPPSMAWQGAWTLPVNLTANLRNRDNRYPAAAIEYEFYAGPWHDYNKIHVVWQAVLPNAANYEVLYASIPVTNPPTRPAAWMSAKNLSNTKTDSLVPAIAINRYNNRINQNLHVVWQEEDIFGPGPGSDAAFSDIAYIFSPNSGLTWFGPAGGWGGNVWDNLTQTAANSQMPSIACVPEQYTGSPGGRPNDLSYYSDDVHVSYNEDAGPNNSINVFYLRSTNNGLTWNPRVNVSANTGGFCDAYSSIAVDPFDNPHIAFMRKQMIQREPLWTSPTDNYKPGINPSLWRSFPGPEVGMYGVLTNQVTYAYYNWGTWFTKTWDSPYKDYEFPTVSLDRRLNAIVACQVYISYNNDYEIIHDTNINLTPPSYPLVFQLYRGWTGLDIDSDDLSNDDLFPNLACKKAAMYYSPDELNITGFDDIFTKISGHGPGAAVAPVSKTIMQDGNVKYDWGL
jgi:hypothetical protein